VPKNPSYIVGRKGAGKTAFLIGAALAESAEVVPIQSEDILSEVERLRMRYSSVNGPLVADKLVHVWEVLLFHAAMWAIDPGHGSFVGAAASARLVLDEVGADAIYVVVDNLEDLHRRLDDFEEVITALFRVTSRGISSPRHRALPFKTRFAFPAELLPLRRMAPNAEKDVQDHLIVRWTASELIFVAGNRLRTFLDVHYADAPRKLGLPRRHDHGDRDAAERTLRAVLPSGDIPIDFEGFLDACLAIGSLGIVTHDQPWDRYVVGQFAYTYASDLRPVEDVDKVCVHPLFMHRWFDHRVVDGLEDRDVRLVYPYGSDPSHEEHEV
jgi:hypothetical protein